MGFWERVNAEIKRQRTTQDWVAGKAGISPNTFRGWISKEVLPRVDQAQAIARALGVTVEYLVTGSDHTDPWLRENAYLLADLKAISKDELSVLAAVARQQVSRQAFVELEVAEEAPGYLPDIEAGIKNHLGLVNEKQARKKEPQSPS